MRRIEVDFEQLGNAATEISGILNNEILSMENELRSAANTMDGLSMANISVAGIQRAVSTSEQEISGLQGRVESLAEATQQWDNTSASRLDRLKSGHSLRFDSNGIVMPLQFSQLLQSSNNKDESSLEIFSQKFTHLLFQLYNTNHPNDMELFIQMIINEIARLPPHILLRRKVYSSKSVVIPYDRTIYTFEYHVDLRMYNISLENKERLRITLEKQMRDIFAVSVPFPGSDDASLQAAFSGNIAVGGQTGFVGTDVFLLSLGIANIKLTSPQIHIVDNFSSSIRVEIKRAPNDGYRLPKKESATSRISWVEKNKAAIIAAAQLAGEGLEQFLGEYGEEILIGTAIVCTGALALKGYAIYAAVATAALLR